MKFDSMAGPPSHSEVMAFDGNRIYALVSHRFCKREQRGNSIWRWCDNFEIDSRHAVESRTGQKLLPDLPPALSIIETRI